MSRKGGGRRGPPGSGGSRGGRRAKLWLPAGLAIVIVAAAAWWLWPVAEGTPRLVLDRTDVDLGYLAYDAPARAVFTLTNGGDGTLRLTETPQVVLKAGC